MNIVTGRSTPSYSRLYASPIPHFSPKPMCSNQPLVGSTPSRGLPSDNAGKSTFLRSTALLLLLAHTGSMVPAKFMSFPVMASIFTRFETSDDIAASQSHHSKEMQELGQILRAVTVTSNRKEAPKSLILVDELGRSTNTVDGFSIAYAAAERLACTPNVLTLFTTHFTGLGALQHSIPIVKNFHLETTSNKRQQLQLTAEQVAYQNQIAARQNPGSTSNAGSATQSQAQETSTTYFTYRVVRGALEDAHYGIDTARSAGFPEKVLAVARDIRNSLPARRLTSAEDFSKIHHPSTPAAASAAAQRRNVVRIAEQISNICATIGSLSDAQLRASLIELKKKVLNAGANRRQPAAGSRSASMAQSQGDTLS